MSSTPHTQLKQQGEIRIQKNAVVCSVSASESQSIKKAWLMSWWLIIPRGFYSALTTQSLSRLSLKANPCTPWFQHVVLHHVTLAFLSESAITSKWFPSNSDLTHGQGKNKNLAIALTFGDSLQGGSMGPYFWGIYKFLQLWDMLPRLLGMHWSCIQICVCFTVRHIFIHFYTYISILII